MLEPMEWATYTYGGSIFVFSKMDRNSRTILGMVLALEDNPDFPIPARSYKNMEVLFETFLGIFSHVFISEARPASNNTTGFPLPKDLI